jgi:hypothetical protein
VHAGLGGASGLREVRGAADPAPGWLADATTRLERLAGPVFGRACPMPAATAAALRISALCLTMELESRGVTENRHYGYYGYNIRNRFR